MEQMTYPEMILKHFGYPLTDYRFSIVYQSKKSGFNDQFVAFASGRCGIGFTLDRGDVFVSVISADSASTWVQGLPDPWFDIGLVVRLLTPGMTVQELAHYYPTISWEIADSVRIDQQLAKLACKLQPYWDRILELCKSGELSSEREQLENFEKTRSDEIDRELREGASK